MKKIIFTSMGIMAMALVGCKSETKSETAWIVDRFDDIKVIRYEVPEFEKLSLNDKVLVY